MSEASDLKKVVENIISSYEARIQDMASIFVLGDFRESILNTKEERERINTRLRDILAEKEHLRRKDFDHMMQGILSTQEEREREARSLLNSYLGEQKEMAQALRKNLEGFRDSLSKGEAGRVKESQALIKEILTKQEKRKEEVTSKLKEFQKEQRELAERLKRLLTKGSDLRIKDLKSTLEDFKAQREKRLALRKRRKEEVAEMLEGFKKARQKFRLSSEAIKKRIKK
jgi:hypothetical protein